MSPTRNYLLVFLALTTIAVAALAWTQHLEIIKLNAALQLQAMDAQRHQNEFEGQLAELRAGTAKNNIEARQALSDAQGQRSQQFENMRALLNDPQFLKLLDLEEKATLDSAYAPLFKQLAQQLGLSPAEIAAFQNLLTQKQDAARDVLMAAREQGLDPRTDRAEISQLVEQSNQQMDNQIEQTLGPDAYAQYQSYEETLPERNTVNQIQQSLSYTNAPLTDPQAQQLIPTLAANLPSTYTYNPTSIRRLISGATATSPITPAAISAASAYLSPPQITALVNQKTVQEANTQIGAMFQASSVPMSTPAYVQASAIATSPYSNQPVETMGVIVQEMDAINHTSMQAMEARDQMAERNILPR